MLKRIASILRRYVIASVWVYYTLLFLWASAYFVTGDRYPVFAILNTVALYLFVPLPIAALVAILARRRELWLGLGVGVVIFAILWGGLFVPRGSAIGAATPSLSVMTYNVLGYNQDVSASVELIRDQDADVVFLQEVNTGLSRAIERELRDQYPYQVLDPYDDVRGMGTISKFPISPTGEALPLQWVGTPQILALDWEGRTVTLVNFHMWAVGLGPAEYIEINYRAREAQALYLSDFVQMASRDGPVIVAGDANATPLSDVYRMLTRRLKDSWLEAGYGFGHTFPGSNVPGSSSPQLYGIPVPRWLFRIDYVFHSDHLQAASASMAPFDGVSDHRGVVVTLVLQK